MAKKKKLSPEEKHRQLQDQLQALPYALADLEKKGEKRKHFMLKYIGGPFIKFMNKMMNSQRYKGPEGAKLKQSEQMKRHLDQRQKALQYVQGEMGKQQKSRAAKKRAR
jgi:hypothetical protein